MAQTNTNTRITGTLPPVSRRTRAQGSQSKPDHGLYDFYSQLCRFYSCLRVFWAAVLVVFAAAADFLCCRFAAAFVPWWLCDCFGGTGQLNPSGGLLHRSGLPFTLGFAPRSVIEAGRSESEDRKQRKHRQQQMLQGVPAQQTPGLRSRLWKTDWRGHGLQEPGSALATLVAAPWGEVSPVGRAVRAAAWAFGCASVLHVLPQSPFAQTVAHPGRSKHHPALSVCQSIGQEVGRCLLRATA